MALIDYEFYTNEYGGGAVTEESFASCEKQAEIFLHRLTFGRIKEVDGNFGQYVKDRFETFTEDELSMLKNGLCALTETIYKLNKAEDQALSGNTDAGNVKSRSSGGESISYESQTTIYDAAIKDSKVKTMLYRSALMEWIVPESFRLNPFYAGSR